MKQYLIILLDDTSTSYCHYDLSKNERRLISINDLKAGILFGMKENLMIQYVLPDYELPMEYKEVMNSIDSHIIIPSSCEDLNAKDAADVVVFNGWTGLTYYEFEQSKSYVLRTNKADFFDRYLFLNEILSKLSRLSVTFIDEEKFTEDDFTTYKRILANLSAIIEKEYEKGHPVQFNLLTDRMMLKNMNNCGAGDTNITLAPDGKFYVCPAFYYDDVCDGNETSLDDVCQKGYSIGSLKDGLGIKNSQLYELNHAPLCRKCDAYHCKRCIWLNRRTTLEVNTPSHEQCVVSHIERNASRDLLNRIRKHGTFLLGVEEIKKIDYLDIFDVRDKY